MAPQAQADFDRLAPQVEMDEQIIRNFGFEKTTEDIESWAQLGEEAREQYEETASEALRDAAFAAVMAIPRFVPSPTRAQELSDKLQQLLQEGGVPRGDELYELAKRAGQKMSEQEVERLNAGLGESDD